MVFRRVGCKQGAQGGGVGHAVDRQAHGQLELLDGGLGCLVEVAVGAAVVVAQLVQAQLHILHALVVVAAAQGDVAAVFRGGAGEELLLHGHGGDAGLLETHLLLEALHGGDGGGVVAAADLALQVVQLLQALVQLAHAVAAVAALQIDVGGAGGGGVGIETAQGVGVSHAGALQAVLTLEQGHGLLGAGAEDAVRVVREVAKVAQALLHLLHAPAGAAALQGLVGIVGLQAAGQDGALQILVGHAGHRQVQIGLQQLHGALGAPAEDAVDVVVVVAQVIQRLLDGGHRVAAAATAQRGVLGRGLQQIPHGALAVDGVGAQQAQARGAVRHDLGGVVHEGEGGQGVFILQHAVHVQLAADGLDAVGAQAEPVAQGVAREGGESGEAHQATVLHVHGVDRAGRGEHEQRVLAGGQLGLDVRGGREDHAPQGVVYVVALQGQVAGAAADVVHGAADDRPVLHAGVHLGGDKRAVGLHVQVAGVGEVEVEVLERGDLGRNLTGEADEACAHGVVDVRARALDLGHDHAVGGAVDALQILGGLEGHRREAGVQIQLHQLLAIGGGDVMDALLGKAGGESVVGDDGLCIVVQVQADEPGAGNAGRGVLLGQEQNAVGIDGQHTGRRGGVHRRVQARYVDAAVPIQECGQLAIARNHAALTAGLGGIGRGANENQSQHKNEQKA